MVVGARLANCTSHRVSLFRSPAGFHLLNYRFQNQADHLRTRGLGGLGPPFVALAAGQGRARAPKNLYLWCGILPEKQWK